MIDRNSSGERLYKDTGGVKCNIRGMIQREPEWVVSRFNVMEDERDKLKARVDSLEEHGAYAALHALVKEGKARVTELEKEKTAAFNKGMCEGLVKGAEAACEGCREGWPVELVNDEEVHRLPEGHTHNTNPYMPCAGWWRYGDV